MLGQSNLLSSKPIALPAAHHIDFPRLGRNDVLRELPHLVMIGTEDHLRHHDGHCTTTFFTRHTHSSINERLIMHLFYQSARRVRSSVTHQLNFTSKLYMPIPQMPRTDAPTF